MTARGSDDCGEQRPLGDFHHNKRGRDGLSRYCKECHNERTLASYHRRRAGLPSPTDIARLPAEVKRCPDCYEVKLLADFPRHASARDGRGSYCKPCHNARTRATRQRLYGGSREYHLRRRYGVTSAQVDTMVEVQFGKCAVCQTAPAEHVDHDHETGAVRGILCFNCNGALGHVRDRIDVLLAAIDYLQAHAPTQERGRLWRKTLEAPGVYRLSS